MSYNKNENKINEEQVSAYLQETLKRIESDNDPESLDEFKKLFKKNIPLTRRSYVAAYLIRQACGRSHGRFEKNDRFGRNDRGSRFDRNNNVRAERAPRAEGSEERAERAEHTERAPRVQIDPSQATTIFIGIGRNRRVFPRDLVGLLVSAAGLDRDRIGDIRVLANYSFIQLFTEDCEKVINALNGYDYRGRKLSVSYSRQKEEGEVNAEAGSAPVDAAAEDRIPDNVSNESSGIHAEASEESKYAEEQSAYAAQQSSSSSSTPSSEPTYSETSDDGQVKSHFGSGDTNYLV